VAEQRLLGLQEGQPLLDVLRREEAPDAPGDHPGDHRRGELAGGGQQPVAVVHAAAAVGAGAAEQRPFALLVELADHPRAHVLAPVVELFLELVFDELAFSSTTRISSRPSAKRRTPSASSGHTMPTL
jgi:hypothetical protein